ncbi:MAG: hypothetical protein AB8E82_19350 [Aureispira sp.]
MTLLEQLQADAAFYLLNILGFTVVVLLTWLLTRRQQARALAALQQQQQQTNTDAKVIFLGIAEQIDHEKEYLRRCVQLLEQALLDEDVEALRQQRYQLVHGLMDKYRPKVARAAQFWADYYHDHKKQQQILAEQILVPFLETCRQVVAAVNAKAVIKLLPKDISADQAFVLEQGTLQFALDALQACGRGRWAKQYQKAMPLEVLAA